MITLQHGRLRAVIDPVGAELRSLQRSGEELLWQAQAGVWQQTAPWLFPFVGRLRGGAYLHRGQHHALPLHGFAAAAVFEPLDPGVFRLQASAATRAVYPFDFELRIAYRLGDAGLHIGLRVCNRGPEPMPFGLGAHPGFALAGALTDWQLQFEQPEAEQLWRLQADPAPWGLRAPVPEAFAWTAPGRLQLHPRLFARDALILDPVRSRWVALVHRERGEHLRMHLGHPVGAPQLGLWARPGAPFVCIEPWWGRDDDPQAPEALRDKPQLHTLAPGAVFETGLQILPA